MHLQPRAALVWTPSAVITVHAGYARSVAAAPLDEIDPAAGTDPIERDGTIDAGGQWRQAGWTLGVDGYVRRVRNLFAAHYPADGLVGEAFSYRRARLSGVEAVATYTAGGLSGWANLAWSRARGTGVSSGQAAVASTARAYLAGHRVPLDTDQRLTASAGAALRLDEVSLSGDLTAGTGTPRTAAGGVPNGSRNPGHITADLAVLVHLHLIEDLPAEVRLDLRNLFNGQARLGDGTALGGGAPGWTEPRGLYLGIEQSF